MWYSYSYEYAKRSARLGARAARIRVPYSYRTVLYEEGNLQITVGGGCKATSASSSPSVEVPRDVALRGTMMEKCALRAL